MAQGHVRHRGKSWAYVHWVIDPATGTKRQRWRSGFSTRRDAERALRDVLTAVDTGSWIEPTVLKLGAYLADVWLPQLEDQVESSTWDSYERNVRVHVVPHLGGTRLQQLQPAQLNALYRNLLNGAEKGSTPRFRHSPQVYEMVRRLRSSGLSYQAVADQIRAEIPEENGITRHAVARIAARSAQTRRGQRRGLSVTTVRYIHAIISRALNDAVKLGLVARNVASAASPPRSPRVRPERNLWSGEETRRFLTWAREVKHRLWPAWAFVATSGDRRGANLGLHWSDVDLDRGRARLIWTVTAVRHQIVVKPYGKAGDPHEILLDAPTAALLRWWRARQAEERSKHDVTHDCPSPEPGCELPGYHRRDLVFCRADGDYLQPERFTREFQRAQVRYNRDHRDTPLPLVDLHALRHGWATLALEAGVPMKVVQDRLNHSSERVTADIYTHVREALQSDAADRVALAIFGPDFDLRRGDAST